MSILYHNNIASPDVQQIIIVSLFTNKQVTCQAVNKIQGVALKTPSALIRGTNTIAQFLASGHKIAGQQPQQILQISQWFQYMNIELHPVLLKVREYIFGVAKNKEIFTYAQTQINRVFKVFDEHLSKRTFFVGDCLTVFDICLCINIDSVMRLLITEDLRKKLRNLTRWFCFVRDLQPIKTKIGRVVLCGNQPINIDFAYQVSHNELKKQTVQQKSQKVKKPKKQEKKEEQKIVQKEEKIAQQKQEKKQTDQGRFNLQDFKRKVVNSEIEERKHILTQFFDSQHSKNWNIWKIHYEKDVGQGKIDYLTNNLAKGTLARLEGINKKAFGSWGVYGVQGNYEVRGVMMWEGNQICKQWKEHPSYAYHLFTKLDGKSEYDRKLVLDYWLKENNAEGLPLYDSKFVV